MATRKSPPLVEPPAQERRSNIDFLYVYRPARDTPTPGIPEFLLDVESLAVAIAAHQLYGMTANVPDHLIREALRKRSRRPM